MPSSLKQPEAAGVLEIIIHVCPFLAFVSYPSFDHCWSQKKDWSYPTVTAFIVLGAYCLIFFVHKIGKNNFIRADYYFQ